jgi:hypothetical protein
VELIRRRTSESRERRRRRETREKKGVVGRVGEWLRRTFVRKDSGDGEEREEYVSARIFW